MTGDQCDKYWGNALTSVFIVDFVWKPSNIGRDLQAYSRNAVKARMQMIPHAHPFQTPGQLIAHPHLVPRLPAAQLIAVPPQQLEQLGPSHHNLGSSAEPHSPPP